MVVLGFLGLFFPFTQHDALTKLLFLSLLASGTTFLPIKNKKIKLASFPALVLFGLLVSWLSNI
jgi:hypothetical protein